MFSQFRISSIFIALPTALALATGALAADRPTNPADWPALKDVYKDYFLIGNTNLNANNFGANVVPGENSSAAMTVKHFNGVTPDNAMKPQSLWGAGITNQTPAGFVVESIKYNPTDCAVIPGKPCHVTVVARGPDPAAAYKNVGVENTATYVLSFGQMAVSWFNDTGALEAPLSHAEVRFSDGVTKFKQYKTYYAGDGVARASGATELKPVPKHGRSTLVLKSQDPIAGPIGLRLNKDSTTEKAWRLVKRFEPGRTYMVVSAGSVFQDNGETKAYALTNRSKPATTATANPPAVPESLSRTPVILRGNTLLPLRNTNAPESEPALAQDNHKFVFEEMKSPAAGPYAVQEGHTMISFIHGTNVYPHTVFRGNGATGTVVEGQHSLITRQTNGQEGSQIADRALDQAVWFNTPIDQRTGEMKMFLYTGRGATHQHYALKEVEHGNTPNRDAGNALSQRQAATGGFVALQAGSPEEGTPVKLYAYDMEPYVPGDVNGDAVLTCADLSAATASIGKRAGQPGFLPAADLDQNGMIDIRDIAAISRLLPAGTRC